MKNLRRMGALFFMVLFVLGGSLHAEKKIKLRLSASSSATEPRGVAMTKIFGPEVSSFADFEPHWNSTLYAQQTELEALMRGNLEMTITSAQEMSIFIPAFSIFAAGYVHRDAAHQVAVFNDPLMDGLKKQAEKLGLHLVTVFYLGRRQLDLRGDKKITTPADLAGVKLRMPGTETWQFLGKALGANPVPMAFTEVYLGLQTGTIDGQDNPLPTTVDKKFYEVTNQIVLTSHLVDLNYLAVSMKVWRKLKPDQKNILQKAAEDTAAEIRKTTLAKEDELVGFLKQQGLKVYEPDVNAFRKHVQQEYLKSKLAKSWPKGLLDKINAAGTS